MKELTKIINFSLPIKNEFHNDLVQRDQNQLNNLIAVVNPLLNYTSETDEEKISNYNALKQKMTEVATTSVTVTQAGLLQMYYLNAPASDKKAITYDQVQLKGKMWVQLNTNPDKIELTNNELKILKEEILLTKMPQLYMFQIIENLEK